MKAQAGFTLLEVLMAAVIVGVACSALMSMMSYASLSSSSTIQNEVISNVLERLGEAFSDNDQYCKNMLGGIPLDPLNSSGTPVAKIDRFDVAGNNQGNILTVGGHVDESGLVVQDIRLRPLGALDAQTVVADLQITVLKTNVLGAPINVSHMPVYAVIQAGKIFSCSTSATNSAVIGRRLCETSQDGFVTWDPVAGSCTDIAVVKWFPSLDGNQTATCGVGYQIAASQFDVANNAHIACASNVPGVGVQTRVYSNGAKSGLPSVSSAIIKFANNTCYFTFPVGAAGFNAAIRCIPVGFLQ